MSVARIESLSLIESQWHTSRRIQMSTIEKTNGQQQTQASGDMHAVAARNQDKIGTASFGGAGAASSQPQIAEDNALIRLANDLSMSTPILMIMTIYFVVSRRST